MIAQINDQKIKHNPTACNSNGCVCLSITENDVVFFGKYGSALNLLHLLNLLNTRFLLYNKLWAN